MSVAFTREESAERAAEVELPDRPISPHPNFVTASGLELLKEAVAKASADYEACSAIEDVDERRRASALPARDLRYFTARLQDAQLIPASSVPDTVAFGDQVAFQREDGRRQIFRIVGEDEADPAKGSISFVSPMARALLGKRVGDTAVVQGQEIEIIAIGQRPS
jgi:transcription elongation GreA/GreB family factor